MWMPAHNSRSVPGLLCPTAVRDDRCEVESAWGAVPKLLPARFPRPLAEPGVPITEHRALHGSCRQAWLRAQGLGIVLPR